MSSKSDTTPSDDTHTEPSPSEAIPSPPAKKQNYMAMQLKKLLSDKTPVWLYVACCIGIFLNLMGLALLISPNNRHMLLDPSIAELKDMGYKGQQIANWMAYTHKITPMVLNTGAAVCGSSILSLIAVIFRYKAGVYVYMLLTAAMIIMTLIHGIFNPGLLLVPTAIIVTASLNREQLR